MVLPHPRRRAVCWNAGGPTPSDSPQANGPQASKLQPALTARLDSFRLELSELRARSSAQLRSDIVADVSRLQTTMVSELTASFTRMQSDLVSELTADFARRQSNLMGDVRRMLSEASTQLLQQSSRAQSEVSSAVIQGVTEAQAGSRAKQDETNVICAELRGSFRDTQAEMREVGMAVREVEAKIGSMGEDAASNLDAKVGGFHDAVQGLEAKMSDVAEEAAHGLEAKMDGFNKAAVQV